MTLAPHKFETEREPSMSSIFYIIGLIVVVLAVINLIS
jgi:hypothetical protein